MSERFGSSPAARWPSVLSCYVLVMMILDGLCLLRVTYAKYVSHMGWPYDSILPHLKGADLTVYTRAMPLLHTYAFFTTNPPYAYPAPVIFVYAAALYPRHYLAAFDICLVGMFIAAGLLLLRSMILRGASALQSAAFVLIAVTLAYPVYFEIRQDNVEPLLFVLISAALWLMLRGKDHPAAILLGIAGSMKIYPFVFLGLLIARRKYAATITSLATAAIVTVIALRFLTPSISFSWHGVGNAMAGYRDSTFLAAVPSGVDHSLFTVIKVALLHLPPFLPLHRALKAYLLITAIGGVVLFFTRIRKLPLSNQVLCLSLAATFLPPSSFDYTLIHLFLPLFMLTLVALERRKDDVPGLTATFMCLAFLMAAETEFIRNGFGYGGVAKAVVFLMLFYAGLRYPFSSSFDGRLGWTGQPGESGLASNAAFR